jgi:hypothetical protein
MEIGQKVVCIDDKIKPGKEEFVRIAYKNWIKEGNTYIVRDIFYNDDLVTGIVLKEVVNGPIPQPLLGGRWQEPAFRCDRFRELDEFEEEESVEEEVNISEVLEILN